MELLDYISFDCEIHHEKMTNEQSLEFILNIESKILNENLDIYQKNLFLAIKDIAYCNLELISKILELENIPENIFNTIININNKINKDFMLQFLTFPNISSSNLTRFINLENDDIKIKIAVRHDLTKEVIDMLLKSTNVKVKSNLASNISIDFNEISFLVYDASPNVRLNLLHNKNCTKEICEILKDDKISTIVDASVSRLAKFKTNNE